MKLRYKIRDSGVKILLPNGDEKLSEGVFEVPGDIALKLLRTPDGLEDPRFEVAE